MRAPSSPIWTRPIAVVPVPVDQDFTSAPSSASETEPDVPVVVHSCTACQAPAGSAAVVVNVVADTSLRTESLPAYVTYARVIAPLAAVRSRIRFTVVPARGKVWTRTLTVAQTVGSPAAKVRDA